MYATDATSEFCAMAQSVIYNGAILTVDGLNENHSDPKSRKTFSFYEMSKRESLNDPNQILVFLDAYDTFMLRSSDDVVQMFTDSGAIILYNAEKNCWPFGNDDDARKKYCHLFLQSTPDALWPIYKGDPAPRFLNSGGMLCRAGSCFEWFNESLSSKPDAYTTDDQAVAFYLCIRWGRRCLLDYFSSIFQSMYLSYDEVVEVDGTFTNTITKSKPAFVHFNGDKSGIPAFAERQRMLNNYSIPETMTFYKFGDDRQLSLSSICQK